MSEILDGWNKELYDKLSFAYLIECAENNKIDEWNSLYLEYLASEWERLYPEREWDTKNVVEMVVRDISERHVGNRFGWEDKISWFKEPNFFGRDFREAISRGVCFNEAHLEGANFRGAHLGGKMFYVAQFQRAHLEGADFFEAHLEGAYLLGAYLEEVDFCGGHLMWARFQEADLRGAKFKGANLEGAKFWGGYLEGVDFNNAHLKEAQFQGTHLEGVDFKVTTLEGANFWETHLEGANFQRAHLEKTEFQYAHLEGATFQNAHLEGAYFREAHLEGANFTYAIVDGETLYLKNFVDKSTDFTGTGLSAVRIDPNLRTKLERNIREIQWKMWYCKSKISPSRFLKKRTYKIEETEDEYKDTPSVIDRFLLNPFVQLFWWISDYGSSTKRIIAVFFGWNILWAVIYYYLLPFLPGISTTVLNVSTIWAAILQTNLMMFSITDLATEGLALFPMLCVTIHIVVGYFILAALITRLGIMFQNLSP